MKYGPHLVRLDVCCNDPDNGNFDGRAAGIQLQDMTMELMAHDLRGPVFRVHADHIQISRRRFAYERSKDWYGNWVWNAYWLDVDVAVELLAYVHSLGVFGCDQAEERLFAMWKRKRPFDDADRDLLGRLMVKADLAEHRERMA